MTTAIKITERQLQKRVTDAAQALGWTCYHTRYSLGSEAGFPDLACFHPEHGALYLELKVGRNHPTAAQRAWLTLLYAAGQRVAVLRESDHDHQVLLELLTGEARHLELADGVYGLEG